MATRPVPDTTKRYAVECTQCHEVLTLRRLPKVLATYVCIKCSKLGQDLKIASKKGGFRFGV